MGLGEPAVGVGDPLVGQALEEGVEILVVAAYPPCPEAGGQEDGVDPVRFAVAEHSPYQLRRYRETIADLFIRNLFAHQAFGEVQNHGLGTDHQFDGIADAIADLVALQHDRLEQRAQRLQQRITGGRRPARALRRQNGLHPFGVVSDVGRFAGGEDGLDFVGGQWVVQRLQLRTSEVRGRTGHHQQAAVVPVCAQLIQEHHLVGEDVGRVTAIVVEVAQLGVQKTWRPRRRHHPTRPHLGDVLPGAVHPALPLLGPERLLGAGRHVVDHRVPDRSGVLQQVYVDVPESGCEHVQIDWPGIVHVENRCRAVRNHQCRVTDGAVGGGPQGDHHDVQVAFWSGHPVLDRIAGLKEPVKP